jgi:hypothetical protein
VKNLLRLLTVWLLILAVPCQGMAAASMRAYAPGQPSAQPIAASAMQHAMHQMDQAENTQLPPCHQAASKAQAADQGAKPAPGGALKCASCAACAIFAAALPASSPALACHASAGAACASAEQRLPSVHLAQPERPPRPRLV